VELYNPPQTGDAYASNSKAVEADITVYHPTFFESVFERIGWPNDGLQQAVPHAIRFWRDQRRKSGR